MKMNQIRSKPTIKQQSTYKDEQQYLNSKKLINQNNKCSALPKNKEYKDINVDESTAQNTSNSFEKQLQKQQKYVNPPEVTASAYSIWDGTNNRQIYGKNHQQSRQIASLTKIMTCYLITKIMQRLNLSPRKIFIRVSEQASSIIGTTANLEVNDTISTWDLLHGLMLPSGNDAAWTIAESYGLILYYEKQNKLNVINYNLIDINEYNIDEPQKYFIQAMNQLAKQLDMTYTNFDNPHGLMNTKNRSCAQDICKLSSYAIRDDYFKKIVSIKEYTSYFLTKDLQLSQIQWENTNKLLWKNFQGLKTGVTKAAGPCLASYYQINCQQFIIVTLNSESMDIRWSEHEELLNWVLNYFQ